MKKVVIAAILMLALSPVTALAGDTVNVDMDVEIPQVVNIDWSVNGSSVQLVDANAITPAEFIAGEKGDIFGGAISCDSNEAWDITVEASNDTFDYTGSALPVPNKPTAWLRVDLDGAGTYDHQLNGTNAITIIDEQAPALAETHSILYKLGFTSNDKPGIYSTDLTYTIVID